MTRLLATSCAACITLVAPPALASSEQTGPLRINGPLSVETEAESVAGTDPVPQSTLDEKPLTGSPSQQDEPETGAPDEQPSIADGPQDLPAEDATADEAGDSEAAASSLQPDPQSEAETETETEIETPAATVAASEKLPLGQSDSPLGSTANSGGADSRIGGVMRTVGATAAVIALILLLRFAFVKLSGTTGGLRAQLGPAGKAPSGVLFVLGRYPVSRGMSLVLLQLDQRVLLLSQTGAGFHTLAELTDADEVASIIRKVKDESGESISARFTGMLKKFESDPATLDDIDSEATARPVRLRQPEEAFDEPFAASQRSAGYYEPKPERSASTGEDELRSRINRLREYGA